MYKFLLFCNLALLAGWTGVSEASLSGLNSRPANPTCIAPARPPSTAPITSQQVFTNLSFADISPISMSQPPSDPSRWIVAERLGKIFSFANDNTVTTKQIILDITDRMQFTDTTGITDSQQYGITSIAFHPQFTTQPYLYVAYNARPSLVDPVRSVISRFTSSDGGQTFDSTSELIIISVDQTDSVFHHVGQIIFGPDQYLYIGLGDGGKGFMAQDLNELRGSILRIDINQGTPYSIPANNPLVGTGFREEIYAWGLRNPWRFTFDRATGDLWLGDVGESLWEEINRIDAGGNYGWPELEGAHCRKTPNCDTTDLIPPVLEIAHPTAFAIIGGYVYRGNEIPSLIGTYIFGDSVTPDVQGLFYDSLGVPSRTLVATTLDSISAFAEAINGELYFFRFRSSGMFKLAAANSPPPVSSFPKLLSETGCFNPANPTIPSSGLIPYTVNTPLWSDGAEKKRWIALPDGKTIDITPNGDLNFPVGTVLIKTFSFNNAPVETRLFIRHADGGWGGYSYEWRADLSDADLLPAGKNKQITPTITWKFPSRNECFQCHTDVANFSLGPQISQLNGLFVYPSTLIESNQLDTLNHIGLFTNGLPDQLSNLPALVPLTSTAAPVERKARSYLHSNCSGCHQPNGPVQSSIDFRFSTPVEAMNVCNALPEHGDLGIIGSEVLTPGDPINSIIPARLNTNGIKRMPPLGRTIVDTAGSGVISSWISKIDVCDIYPDTDTDQIRDNVDNCTLTMNASQLDTDSDSYGNICDADFDNSGYVNSIDLGIFKNAFFTSGNIVEDINADGVVNSLDLGLFKQLFAQPPGPSAANP
ncbi:hypothetical protein MNBD_GAMMA09-3266 [hydrothermal vent metagenome]|uniref:Glucose/Sorbosone dehydrogenase domain-containing protein n=1 Tax=hydrothermal vent metagenome TaxID=652676 RepID=A0A3B0XR84_9ZZZZ